MQDLQTFINVLTRHRRLHISILDLSGILNTPKTTLSLENTIHSKRFCDVAKSTEKGFHRCLRCKAMANGKAVAGKTEFSGYCFNGLYEAAYPVVINDSVAAVVYVGNIIIDEERTRAQIKKACAHTGVDTLSLLRECDRCERLDDPAEALVLAEIVADYLRVLSRGIPKPSNDIHWLAAQMKRYADDFFCNDICLKNLACIYHKNEKYMGRLFKSEIGVDFHTYCNSLRLKKAAGMLESTREKVLDIALECGFNNISYFNRVFLKEYGTSPTAYRRKVEVSL